MPIYIRNFTWRQTPHLVFIRVPLKGVRKSNIDIFMLDNFIKVNYPPFLFEIFLAHPVNFEENKCSIIEDELVFEINKEAEKHWDSLEMELSKEEKIERKRELVDKAQTEAAKKRSIKLEKVSAREKQSVSEQMKLETKAQKKIKELRESLKNEAMEDFNRWRQKSIKDKKNNESKILLDQPQGKNSPHSSELSKGDAKSKLQICDRNVKELNRNEAAVRGSGKIEISFTPREFPTPCRESKLPEEEEWLRKQIAARRESGFVAEDLRPEECDPQWLKEKGDSFFKMGNYLGAVSAYSHGIKLSNKLPALFSNRSAAHMALKNFHKAAEDASKALELLQPVVEANRESRARAHVRRGTALCTLGSMRYGLLDFEAALKLIPNDKKLQEDIKNVKAQIENQAQEDDDET